MWARDVAKPYSTDCQRDPEGEVVCKRSWQICSNVDKDLEVGRERQRHRVANKQETRYKEALLKSRWQGTVVPWG